jgi:hypothetical protein
MFSALAVGLSLATISVLSMLTVTRLHDRVPILPQVSIEWREVIEYGASMLLAFISGNTLGVLIFQVSPQVLSQGGKPNAIAVKAARFLGQYVSQEQLRRRARLIQHLTQTAGPLIGVAVTAVGSLYAGLKGFCDD